MESFLKSYEKYFDVLSSSNITSVIMLTIVFMMVLAAFVSVYKSAKGRHRKSAALASSILAVSYFSTDTIMSWLLTFAENVGSFMGVASTYLSYAIFDAITALVILLVVQFVKTDNESAVPPLSVVLCVLLLINGLLNIAAAIYLTFADTTSLKILIIYSAGIVLNDTVMVVFMFNPKFADKLRRWWRVDRVQSKLEII